jgi:hypothetical protein
MFLLRWEKASSSRNAVRDGCDSDLLNAMSCWTRKGMCQPRTFCLYVFVEDEIPCASDLNEALSNV